MRLIALILLTIFSLSAQTGIVVDKDSGTPVAGVKVTLGNEVDYTDASGHFEFASVVIPDDTASPVTSNYGVSMEGNSFSSDDPGVDLSVYNLQGSKTSGSSLSSGIYFVIAHKDGVTVKQRWIVSEGSTSRYFATKSNSLKKTAADGPYNFLFEKSGYLPEVNTHNGTNTYQVKLQYNHTDKVFPDTVLTEYRITVSASDSLELYNNGFREDYVPAQVRMTAPGIDTTFAQVGLRHKGAYSVSSCWDNGVRQTTSKCKKISYKIKFNKYDTDSRLYGLKKLNLHSMSGGYDAKVNQALSYYLFREAGVKTARTTFSKVYINGEYAGLFLSVENIDGRFTKYNWPLEGDGNLYKEVWPVDSTTNSYTQFLKTNDDVPETGDMVDFYNTIDTTTNDNFRESLSKITDVDQFTKYLAVDRMVDNWDGPVTWYHHKTPHNFYWYNKGGKFILVPWDVDNTFQSYDVIKTALPDEPLEWNVVENDCSKERVSPNTGLRIYSLSCDPLSNLLVSNLMGDIEDEVNRLDTTVFKRSDITARIDMWTNLIDAAASQDTAIDYVAWTWNVNDFKNNMFSTTVEYAKGQVSRGQIIPELRWSDSASTPQGLDTGKVNNFEYNGAISEFDVYSDDSTTHAVTNDSANPISGDHSLRSDFTFTESGYVSLFVKTKGTDEIDLSNHSYIVFVLRADTSREVKVTVASNSYADYGNVPQEFHKKVQVGKHATAFKIPLADFVSYSTWARNSWGVTDGWDNDAVALQDMFTKFLGLSFVTSPAEAGSGFLQVDNILFVK